MRVDLSQGLLELSHGCGATAPPALASESCWDVGIAPLGQIVVGVSRFTDQCLHPIEAVVQNNHYRLRSREAHHAYLLHRELVRTITGHQHHPMVGFGNGTSQARRGAPTDRTPKSLAFHAHAGRESNGVEFQQAGASVRDQDIVGTQETLQAGIKIR